MKQREEKEYVQKSKIKYEMKCKYIEITTLNADKEQK